MKLKNKLINLILFLSTSIILIYIIHLNSSNLTISNYIEIGSIESVGFKDLDNKSYNQVKFAILDTMPNLKYNEVNIFKYKEYQQYNYNEITHSDEMVNIVQSINSSIDIDVYVITDDNGDINNELLLEALNDIRNKKYDVINMSFYTKENDLITKYINEISNKGTLIVASAGNSGNWEVSYPAILKNVISIGGITSNGQFWSNSNRGKIDYVMPVSFYSDLSYSYIEGTSVSAILFSILAVYELKLNPEFTKEQLINLITNISVNPNDKAILGNGQPCLYIKNNNE